jgi:hypothetical protein
MIAQASSNNVTAPSRKLYCTRTKIVHFVQSDVTSWKDFVRTLQIRITWRTPWPTTVRCCVKVRKHKVPVLCEGNLGFGCERGVTLLHFQPRWKGVAWDVTINSINHTTKLLEGWSELSIRQHRNQTGIGSSEWWVVLWKKWTAKTKKSPCRKISGLINRTVT